MTLSALICGCVLVFLLVSELSRVSSVGLDDAIQKDAGQAGTYVATIPSDFGLGLAGVAAALAASPGLPPDTQIGEVLPAVASDCPPFHALGSPRFVVLYDLKLRPVDLPFGHGIPSTSELCYSGQVVPSDAAYLPSDFEQTEWGPVLFLQPTYRDVVALATTDPPIYMVRMVTGTDADQRDQLRDAVIMALTFAAEKNGQSAADVIVTRADDAAGVRAASRGVKVVYGVIGWGVLILGALALLVAESIVVRQRVWFFGLCRAIGARAWHVGLIVLTDIAMITALGVAGALAVGAAAQGSVAQLSHDAFGVRAELISSDIVPGLAAGCFLVMVVAGVLPARKAMRHDPISVLEGSRD